MMLMPRSLRSALWLALAPAIAGCYDLDRLRNNGCPADALLCDDFDEAALDTKLWTPTEKFGSVAPDDIHVFRGMRSLHVHLAPRDANVEGVAALDSTRPFPSVPSARLYIRAYLWGTPPQTPDHDIFHVASHNAPLRGVTVWHDDGFGQICLDDIDAGVQHKGPGTSQEAWHCIEWELTNLDGMDGPTRASRIWVDDHEPFEIPPVAVTPPFDLFRVGTRAQFDYAERLPTDYWLDDVAVARERIGCEPSDREGRAR